MKKYLIIAIAALVAFTACKKEVVYTPIDKADNVVLTFTSERPQIDVATKTAWDANSKSIVWTTGDKIRVGYTLNGVWMAKDGQVDLTSETKVYAKFFASNPVDINSGDAGLGEFSVPNSFTNHPTGKAVFYGVYPSTATDDEAKHAPSLTVSVPTGQKPGDNTFDSSADIMIGKTNEIDLTGSFPNTPIEMNWNRVVAHADLTFSGLKDEEGETVSKITLTFNEEAKAAGSFAVDVTDGTVTTNTNSNNQIVLSGSNLSLSSHNIKAWVCLMPITFTALNVEIETNKAIYTRAISASKTFAKNARNILTINMAGSTRTAKAGQLVADGYYVISYGDHMMTVGTETDSYRGYADKNVSNPSNDAVWKIAYVSASDAYTIHSLGANKDLYGVTSDNTTLTLGTGVTNLFTIKKTNAEATTYKIAPYGNTIRAIGYNTSSPRFALYAGSAQQPIALDLTSVTVSETPVITIEEEERTKEVEANATSVSFTYVPNMFATEAPSVAIATDTDDIINGNVSVSNGIISVTLNPNTENKPKVATLTVSGTGIASPITLTINQKAKAGDVFSYIFTAKNWAATRDGVAENWTSGKDGNSYSTDNGGIQITTGSTGANGTTPKSFINVSKIVLRYCTNGSSGAGSISVKVGNGTAKSLNVTKTGGTTVRTLEYTFSPAESGQVTITVNCTTNSIYLVGADITATSMEDPAAGITVATDEASNTASTDGTTATLNGTITLENGAVIGDVTEAGFYFKADNGSYIKVTVETPATSLTYNLSNLTPSTVTYTYYAYAVYGGNTITGEEKTFTTSSYSSKKTYTLTITADFFNTTSYAANNNEKTSNAIASDNSTFEVKWTSNQVMKNGNNMQWQKSNGYIYNSTDLGTIKSVTVTSSAGSFTTYYGTEAHPTSGTTVGNGFFTVNVGGATGTTSKVVIVFEK